MTNDVNLLMSLVDEINSKSADAVTSDDIDTLIAYHRRNRARKAAGEKFERPTTPKLDIASLLNLPTPKVATGLPVVTRRI
jgi:hypothetical protein